jgi:hypothetical protein
MIKYKKLTLKIARQMHTSCFSPELRLEPLDAIWKSRPFSSRSNKFESEALLIKLKISSSLYLFSGSRLNLRVFSNKDESCGMIVILSLRSARPTVDISTPSISMLPLNFSIILHRANQIVLFPAPVLPTIPTFSPDSIVTFKFLSTTCVSGLYFTE